MKGTFGIGGAIVLGGLIILGAFIVNSRTDHSASAEIGTVVVSKAPTRTSITVTDTDADGIADWEETLRVPITTGTVATSSNAETYTPPTTLTGKFSEAFLQDYLEGKMRGEDFSDPDAFIEQAVKAVEASTQSKKHTRAELTFIEMTDETLRAYGNELVTIMNRHYTPSRNELEILSQAMESEDTTVLAELTTIEENYGKILADTAAMAVPSGLALHHVELLNAYEAILLDVRAMGMIFDDPLYAIARMNAYSEDVSFMVEGLKKIAAVFDARNIVFSQTEPGSFFYIFDAV